MDSYHTLIDALSAHMIHINLNTIFFTHIEHSFTKKNNLHKVLYEETLRKHCEKRKVFSLASKDDRVEQCLRSCGSEFQMWGPKL